MCVSVCTSPWLSPSVTTALDLGLGCAMKGGRLAVLLG